MKTFATLADLAAYTGKEIGVSGWAVIDQARIDRFADATGDHQWIHVDPKRTRSELGTGTIAHGYLTLAMIPALLAEIYSVESVTHTINYGANRIRFVDTVPAGSRIRARLALMDAVAGNGFLRTISNVTVEREGAAKPALVADIITLFHERTGR